MDREKEFEKNFESMEEGYSINNKDNKDKETISHEELLAEIEENTSKENINSAKEEVYKEDEGIHDNNTNEEIRDEAEGSEETEVKDNIPKSKEEKKTSKKNKKEPAYITRKSMIAVVALCVTLSTALGFGGGYLASGLRKGTVSSGNSNVGYETVIKTSTGGTSDTGTMSVVDITNSVANSVVEITTEVTTNTIRGQYVSEGAGSGVIISENGYIVTNNHVIEDSSKINVRLKDGTVHEATLVGTDSKTDIAVIKIEANNLQAAVLGDSDALQVGELAIAIGNPLGELGGTVTSGIISALDREINLDGQTMNLLQTNAAINPGNSGGGLFNGKGDLVGVVVAKSSGNGVEGLGFAIPINDVKKVVEDLINNGYVTGRVVLGVSVVEVSDSQTALMYRVNKYGVYVAEVNSGSNGEKAGLKVGDCILSINGDNIETYEDLSGILGKHSVGDTLKITVLRGNENVELSVVVAETASAS